MCYRNTLSVAKEHKIRTVALSCIYTRRKGYPRDEAAHVAARAYGVVARAFVKNSSVAWAKSMRVCVCVCGWYTLGTIRRFLEHYHDDFDCVIVCVDSLEDQMIYESVLPLYFPRTRDDELTQTTRLAHRALGASLLCVDGHCASQESFDLDTSACAIHSTGGAFGEPVIEERKIRIRPLGSTDNQAAHETDDGSVDDSGGGERVVVRVWE